MAPGKYETQPIEPGELSDKTELLGLTLLDGGRASFYCKNGAKRFWIRTVTDGMEDEPFRDGYWPGGLYLNKKLIEVRSDDEKGIIQALSTMKVPQKWYSNFIKGEDLSEGEAVENLIAYVINFIKSPKYLELALKTNRINKTENEWNSSS